MQKTKHSLFLSVISLILCFSMLLGSTWAWFTDSVTSTNNVIKSGSLKVSLEYMDGEEDPSDKNSANWKDASTGTIFNSTLWEPGFTAVKHIKIENEGSLALEYLLDIIPYDEHGNKLTVDALEVDGVNLAKAIDVYYLDPAEVIDDRADLSGKAPMGTLYDALKNLSSTAKGELKQDENHTITLALKMREDAGNEYQGKSIGSDFAIRLIATQYNSEPDSFDKDYDINSEWPVNNYHGSESVSASVTPTSENKIPAGGVALTNTEGTISASLPEGVLLENNTNTVTLTVSEVDQSQANITLSENEASVSVDVHIDGISKNNDTVIKVDIDKLLPVGLNMGNYRFYHVENGSTVEMTLLSGGAVPVHNNYEYDPATGNVSLYLKSFSEVALVADTVNAWNGDVATAFADGTGSEDDPYIIANADQLAYMGICISNDNANYGSAHYQLIADVNIGGSDNYNENGVVFYPIGYNKVGGEVAALAINDDFDEIYFEPINPALPGDKDGDVVMAMSDNSWYTYGGSFKGTFDGTGHTVSGIYQNTWIMKGNYDGNYYNDAMGLFGYVNGGTVKNLTIDSFYSEGEFAPTGCVTAYAGGSATFENINITNSHPQTYNTGVAGIVGWDNGNSTNFTFKNITVDSTNTMSALWGSWDVAAAGILGCLKNGSKATFENCNVAATIDVYNDVCGNYQYYWYRYSGAYIGTVYKRLDNGNGALDLSDVTATNCTVNFGDTHEYYYCEFVENTKASYTHDYQMSRVDNNDIIGSGDTAICQNHNHEEHGYETVNGASVLVEDKQAVYIPYRQLFGGYGWGVDGVDLGEYENIEITDLTSSEEKFIKTFTGDFLPKVGNANAVAIGNLFKAKDGATINNSGVYVTIDKIDEAIDVSGEFTPSASDWKKGTIQFSGSGVLKITIQDYDFCRPTVLYVEVIDAVNATSAINATSNNVVLINDIYGGFTVSGRNAVYGNGFTCNYTDNGQYLNNGLKQGIITVSENGTLDNLRIKASIYPTAYMYYEEAKKGESTVDGDKTRYHYQLSAVAASGNATISNCYIYGARNNVYINTGDVTIEDTILECGTLSNIQIQSTSDHTVTLNNVTTIQHRVNATIGDTSAVMMGAGVIVGPETNNNPKIVLNGDFKQYNWVTSDDKAAVTNSNAQTIIETAINATNFNHTINGKKASNLGIIYLNNYANTVENNTGLPYKTEDVSIMGQSGKVCSLQNASENQIYSDFESADRTTVNGLYIPQYKYDSTLGGQYIKEVEGADEFCYREGDSIKVMFPAGDTKTLDLASIVKITKYSKQTLDVDITCKDSNGNAVALTDNKITLSKADEYTVTYKVSDNLFYNADGNVINETKEYFWNVTLSVLLKDKSIPNAYFGYDSSKQTMGYAKKSAFAGGNTQYLPFLAGLKIYDYVGQDSYLRFDGDNDFNKIAAAEITSYTSANHVLIKVTLTDGGIINIDTTARAASGGSTYTGTLNTSGNTLYYVNGGTTSATTTTWVISNYTFVGNNGVEVNSGSVTFANCVNGSVPTGSFGTKINNTVTYNANGGNCVQAIGYATTASTAVTLPSPTRSGYIFAGWYTATTGGTRVGGAGESYTPSANITLYAQWGLPCTVTYNANSGSCATASEKYTGAALTLPTATRDGYWFIGWYDAAVGGNKVGDAGDKYNPMNEITLYAHWQEQVKYTVTYNANGGNTSPSSATYEGTALTLPTPTREGHTFNGWYTAATGGTKVGDAGANYTPSANTTIYAQWTVNSYTVTVKTSNANVTVNGSAVSNNGTVSVPYGTQVTVAVTYTQSRNQTTTITGANGTTYTSPFNMPAQEVTINASSSGTCVTADTLVTLADGTQKRIDSVNYNDKLLVWDFDKGEYTYATSSIIENHGYSNNTVIYLTFENSTVVKVVNVHGFFDTDLNKWVDIDDKNVHNYIGHKFAQITDNGYNTVELISASVTTKYIEAWSILTADYYNCVLEGMFSVTPPATEQLAFFDIGENMKYDATSKQADIEKYGLFTYEEFADKMSVEQFEALNVAEIKVAIGKGLITYDELLWLISTYIK